MTKAENMTREYPPSNSHCSIMTRCSSKPTRALRTRSRLPCSEEKLERIRQGATSLLVGGAVLPAGHLEATRVRDANQADPSKAAVQSVAFHPSGQLLLTAGLDKRLTFFQVPVHFRRCELGGFAVW